GDSAEVVDGGSKDLSHTVAALDWSVAAEVARRVADALDRECVPDARDLEYLQSFLGQASHVAHELGVVLGEHVEATRLSLEAGLLKQTMLQSPEGLVIRAMAGMTGPVEHAEAVSRVAELAKGAMRSLEPPQLVQGLVALHELASAGLANLRGSRFD